MKQKHFFISLFIISFFSCAKSDFTQMKQNGDKIYFQPTQTNDEEVGRTLQDILFCDRLDFDNTISQNSPGYAYKRELIPLYKEPGDGIYKYMFIEIDDTDIKNFEFIVSKEPIKKIDLFSETIHNDSLVIRTPGMRQAFNYQVVAKLNDGFHKITELEKRLNIICKDERGFVDWYWMISNKKTGSIVSTEYVGQTIYLCGREGVLGRYGTGRNKMSEE